MRTLFTIYLTIVTLELVLCYSFNTQNGIEPLEPDYYIESEEGVGDDSKSYGVDDTDAEETTNAADGFTDAANVTEISDDSSSGEVSHGTEAAVPPVRERPACNLDNRGSAEDKSTTTLINYPFAVSLQRKGAHYTTGALIDKRWVLSSAADYYHVRESIKLYRARLGSVDCKKGGTLVPLKRVEVHPSYVFGKPSFDLALLRMAQPVDFTDFIRPIGLSKIKTKVISAKFMTTYWPRLIVRGETLPTTAKERIKQNSMRVSTQRLIPTEACSKMMTRRHNSTLDPSSLCLKPFVTHHSTCIPDAGAPVVAEDGLWGITSGWVSDGCKRDPSPTIFTRISSPPVRSWLDSQMISYL